MLQQLTLFTARVGWPGITFGKTDSDVLMKKKREKKADRQRKIDDRVREYVYHAATVSNSFSFQISVPKRPKKSWKSFVS